MKVLVTGAAGFIGMYTAKRLLEAGHEVVGLDNLNTYYDVRLKHWRLEQIKPFENFRFVKMDLADRESIAALFKEEQFEKVIHLAAQAGVRYSLEAPFDYVDSNLVGMMTILEGCRHNKVDHLVYASSSSVYGMNPKIPFSTGDNVDHPVSLYAATKKSNELMAHSYSHLYGIPTTGLRFFTVYGPAGRPDMAPWLFTEAILNGNPIKVFNHGKMQRDFTYIDDIVDGVVAVTDIIPEGAAQLTDSPAISTAPYKIYNIGNNQPVELSEFIQSVESACDREAEKIYLPMQDGDVIRTYADIDDLVDVTGVSPSTALSAGISRFVDWYQEYAASQSPQG
ncbi:NAD-dependent epimerase [Thalassolituus maritimus]|uniref:NAD-dependent epimerase n=1 Tax=Thalassolituus maritimus TaxID=484498 RepID=UPI0026EE986C|nr:NAD-dependent epimerase [Thalassolituus maritimus]|tara:strand:- start:16730 stop:17743 length:1014 start_codon:yes stop_codon:yes gene_type:complete